MIEIGRVCLKIAGRDGGKKAVVVDILDNNYVVIAGETRKRKCNVNHLEFLNKTVKIKKGASDAELEKALKSEGIILRKTKPKKAGPRPLRQHKARPMVKPETVARKKKTKEAKPETGPETIAKPETKTEPGADTKTLNQKEKAKTGKPAAKAAKKAVNS